MVKVGLELLTAKPLAGRVAYLCHAASLTADFRWGVELVRELIGERLVALWGPQHGFQCDVQDNMVETRSVPRHPHFNLPVHSLYGGKRAPTREMLEEIDTLVVDLQDAGTRVYTYLSTLVACLRACAQYNKRIVVLDRPNPAGGELVEGNLLEPKFRSFVGQLPIPMRHGMSLGELALFAQKTEELDVDCQVVAMEGWLRSHFWRDTGRPWVNPSPNLPTPDGAITFCGTVLFEGTRASEGRGTTRPLEIVGAPGIEPWSWWEELAADFAAWDFQGVVPRPLRFTPTFQKHAGVSCGGFQLHVTDPSRLRSWRLGQWLLRHLRHKLAKNFAWNEDTYEYENQGLAIDYINGSERPRLWCEGAGKQRDLEALEERGRGEFMQIRRQCLLY